MSLPILEIPPDLDRLCHIYQPAFSSPQFHQFEHFITGLMVADEANLDALAEGFKKPGAYDALHHFVTQAPWEINDVLEQTVITLKGLPLGQRLHEKGMLIIDDTLIEKYGQLMEAAGKLWDHNENRWLPYAHCLVSLCWADHKKLRYPLRFELYWKEELCKLEENQKQGIKFKTKIQIAIDLIDWAIKMEIPFQTVVFDSWFFTKDLVDHIERLGKDWISMSKANRKVVIAGEGNRSFKLSDYAGQLRPEQLPHHTVRGRSYAIKSVQARFKSLKRGKERVRLIVSFERKSAERIEKEKSEGRYTGDYKGAVYMVSNRKDIRPERIIRGYQIRWSVETFFKDAKSHLGLGEYQMRGTKGIKSHWCLVFTSAVLLELVRWEVCTKEGLNVSQMTLGDIKRRAYGQTLRAIIKRVLEYGRQGLPAEQVYEILAI